jgi:glucose/arabinose dehydrogenase
MRFYTGEQFPEAYLNQILIAEHGSWNRSVPIGYRVTLVRMSEDGKTPLSYEVFAEGWLQNGAAWGRPVDIEQLPDGSILVSDDYAGAIYRIQYVGEE